VRARVYSCAEVHNGTNSMKRAPRQPFKVCERPALSQNSIFANFPQIDTGSGPCQRRRRQKLGVRLRGEPACTKRWLRLSESLEGLARVRQRPISWCLTPLVARRYNIHSKRERRLRQRLGFLRDNFPQLLILFKSSFIPKQANLL
jgi:hypothetical protein